MDDLTLAEANITLYRIQDEVASCWRPKSNDGKTRDHADDTLSALELAYMSTVTSPTADYAAEATIRAIDSASNDVDRRCIVQAALHAFQYAIDAPAPEPELDVPGVPAEDHRRE